MPTGIPSRQRQEVQIAFSARYQFQKPDFKPGPVFYAIRMLKRHSQDGPNHTPRFFDYDGCLATNASPAAIGESAYLFVKGRHLSGIVFPSESRVESDHSSLLDVIPAPEAVGEFLRGFESARAQDPQAKEG